MAWYDEFDPYQVPDHWGGMDSAEYQIYDKLVGADEQIGYDRELQTLFDAAWFSEGLTPFEREGVKEALIDYLWDEYGIDFDDVFDWEAWREWYESA